jgi:hypothetical protein
MTKLALSLWFALVVAAGLVGGAVREHTVGAVMALWAQPPAPPPAYDFWAGMPQVDGRTTPGTIVLTHPIHFGNEQSDVVRFNGGTP